jgi:hypothetical protein
VIGPTTLIMKYGSFAVAGVVCLESMGLPLPGEAILIAAAIYAGKTGDLNIIEVIAAAAAGAIVGDNIGYWIGREIGFRLLVRYGGYVGLTEPRIKVGQIYSRDMAARLSSLAASSRCSGFWRRSLPASIACRGRAFSSSMPLAPFSGRRFLASGPTRSVKRSRI